MYYRNPKTKHHIIDINNLNYCESVQTNHKSQLYHIFLAYGCGFLTATTLGYTLFFN
jgi:hypothetical protein